MQITPKIAREMKKVGYAPTLENLKTFQTARGIKHAPGEISAKTLKELAAVARHVEKNPHFLVAGMKSFDTWKMEADFKKLGVHPGKHDGVVDQVLLDKIQRFKEHHPELHNHGRYAGRPVQHALHKAASLPHVHETHTKYLYPLGRVGSMLGRPFQGTHTRGNWESDRAVDLGVPVGTPIYAVADGVIGSQIGPLSSSDPHLLGQRLHLETQGNEFYYAHLSKLNVHAGQHVKKGQIIGWSGSAAGVPHLHIASKVGLPDHWFNV